jgi:hypothetical protein
MQEILLKNITSLYDELGCEVENQLQIDLTSPFRINFSEKKILTKFSFTFVSNLSIPQCCGLGINSMMGNGVVSRMK